MNRLYRAAQALGISSPPVHVRQSIMIVASIGSIVMATFSSGNALAAGPLTLARVDLSDPRPSAASVTYAFTGSSVDGATAIRCVRLVWSTTATGTTAPIGFNGTTGTVTATSSTLINSSATGWSLARSDGASSTGQNNIYQYTHSGAGVTPGTTSGATFVVAGLTNPSTADNSYYLALNTYTNADCSTGPVDNASVQFITTNGSLFSMTVDQTLSFTVNAVNTATSCNGTTTTASSTSTSIPFGNVTPASNAVACQDLTAATNATNGYTIYMRYTGAPTNGAQSITDHSGTNAAPTTFSSSGTEAYGYATNDASLGTGTANRFTSGGQKWAAGSTTNAEIAFEASGVASTSYRIGHQVGVATTTSPGTYATTIIYTCTPVY